MSTELLTAVAEVQRGMSLLRAMRAAGGNPNHKGSGPGGGQFASGPGGGSSKPHGKHYAKRQRRKAKLLAKLRQKGHAKIAKVRAKQKAERQALREKQRADKASYSQRRNEHKALSEKHKAERQEVIKDLKAEVRKQVGKTPDPEHPKVKELRERKVANEAELKKRIAEHAAKDAAARQKGDEQTLERHAQQSKDLVEWSRGVRSEMRADYRAKATEIIKDAKEGWQKDLEYMKNNRREVRDNPELAARWEKVAALKPYTTAEGFRQEVAASHAQAQARAKSELASVRSNAREEMADHKADFAADRVTLERSQRREWKQRAALARENRKFYADLLKQGKSEWAAKDVAQLKGSDHGQRIAVEGVRRGVDTHVRQSIAIPGRMAATKLHKASSAESILQHCLRQRGWTSRYREGRLTGRQHLTLLEDVRQYGRAWLRHEAEAFFGRYGGEQALRSYFAGRGQDQFLGSPRHQGEHGGSSESSMEGVGGDRIAAEEQERASEDVPGTVLERSLSDRLVSPLKRWFSRMRSFVHELIFAGALAMTGPDELSPSDVATLDRNAQVQVEYLDRFERELIANPPAAIATPAIVPTETIIVSPPPSVAQVIARAEQYGHAVWQSTQQVVQAQAVAQGVMKYERRVLGHPKTHHCEDCPPLAAQGWQPVGTLPAIGETECGGMCYCHFEYTEDIGNTATKVPRRPNKKTKQRRPDLPPPAADESGGSTIPGKKDKGPDPWKHPRPVEPWKPKPGEKDYGQDAGGPWFDANGNPIEYETL